MTFIKYVNPVVAKDAEIAKLKAQLRTSESRALEAEATALHVQAVVEEMTAETVDCSDVCALENALCDAEYDLLKMQGKLNSEIKTGAYWNCKLSAKGLYKEAAILADITEASICNYEYKLAIAAHNLAMCKSQSAPEYIAEKKLELEALLAANPDVDARCQAYIDEVLVKACA